MRWVARILLSIAFAASFAGAEVIDNTCATCGRRSLDSLNMIVGSVRVNQVGYRTDDPHKRALVGSPKASTFRVVRPNGTVAFDGNLVAQGTFPYKGRMLTKGYYNSITRLYTFTNTNDTDSASAKSIEAISAADFGALQEEGTFRVVVGTDTSLPFDIRPTIYNDIFETSLKYFGIERSGDDPSQMHAPSHLKDGSGRPGGEAVAGSLKGGWYDCGDYFKVGQTDAYAFTNLMLAYTLWPQKAEDRYGNSYNDTLPFGNDGIPDLLREAKVGADYVMRLYRASVTDGLLTKNDMYGQVGVWGNDHQLWDQPERQDAAPIEKGGPPRPVDAVGGSAVSAQFAGALALFANAWYPFDPAYSDSILAAAKDIYKRVVIPNWEEPGPGTVDGFYIKQTRWDDDLAWAATCLWYATGDTSYKYDLMDNKAYGDYPAARINASQKEFFWGGFLSSTHTNGQLFSPGGWVMDYQNTFVHSMWMLWSKFYKTDSVAARWGIPAADAKDVRERITKLVGTRYVRESSNSPTGAVYPGTRVNYLKPYGLVWSSITWGMNRYNMGGLLPVVLYHEMIKGDSAASAKNYWNIILDNMNYNMGVNPWDISFLMGAGSKNLQHPHNRISNPEGYNAGGLPYKYRSPKGALMGGAIPGQLLRDEWEKYDVTETCIDFSSQMILPSQYLAQDLPPDTTGPVFFPVTSYPSDSSAIVAWGTDELSRDTLFYSASVNGPVIGYLVAPLSKSKSVTIPGLKPQTTYYFWFSGMDIYRNVSHDDNRGRDYSFTTTQATPPVPQIKDVRACNIRGDHATIFWWTDVPSLSAVEYAVEGANFASTKKRVEGDDEGIPSRFHKVTLKGLQPGTTYRYDVFSAPAKSDSLGLHFRFSTAQDFANYTIQIKATDKNGATGSHFYIEVANNENKPYVGLELRFYFQGPATLADSIRIHTSDNAIFSVLGRMVKSGANLVSFGAAKPVTGVANNWYIPIVIQDTLPVAGRLRIEMDVDYYHNYNEQTALPLSNLANAWSLVPHTVPAPFSGVDLSRLWPGPDQVEFVNGEAIVAYVEDPYIAAYYKGVHIYGYTPDGDLPKVPRNVDFRFEAPAPSPATAVKQDSVMVHFQGRAWGWPDNPLVQVQRDSVPLVSTAPILSRTDSVRFSDAFADPQGTTVHEWAFWADRNTPLCGCKWQRYSVTVDTMKVPPRALHLAWDPADPIDVWTTQRKPLTLKLLDASGAVLDTTATASLSASAAGVKFWSTAAGTSATASVLFSHGLAQIWVSDAQPDTAVVFASAAIPGSTVAGAATTARFSAPPPWPSVDSAWTRDNNCDGVPDSISIALSGELSAGVDLKSLDLALAGATVTIPVGSVHVGGRILSVAAPASLAGDAKGTGVLVLHVTTGGRNLDTAYAFVASDRVGPVVSGISAQERFGTGADTVRASFSEPVVSSGGWPFEVVRGGATIAAPTGSVVVANELPTLLRWSVSGSAGFAAGDLATWSDAGSVTDSSGNAVQTCRAPGAISIRRKSVPFDAASILDVDGDGRADLVRLKFRRAVSDAELPDSVKVEWGATDSVVHVRKSDLVRSVDSATLEASLSFAWGSTAWPFSRANAMVMQGGAADGRRDGLLAMDSVGPVLLAATLRRGTDFDTLRIRISENVVAGAGAELLKNEGGAWTAGQRFQQADSSLWLLVAPSGTFQDGDSVRLAPRSSNGSFADHFANPPAPNAPWIHVQAGDPAPVHAIAQDLDGDGKTETVKLSWARKPKRDHGFVFWSLDTSGNVVVRRASSIDGSWTNSGDTLVVTLADPFPFGATAGFSRAIQSELFADGTSDSIAFGLLDGAAPVVVGAWVRYASVGQVLDTLLVRLGEATSFGGETRFRVVGTDGLEKDVAGVGFRQSADGKTVWITLDPTDPASTNFRQGDRLRVMPGASGGRDGFGNAALETGHPEPIRFGMRPPRFDLDFLPGSWVQADPGKPVGAPIEILVRPLGASTWTSLDGAPVAGVPLRIGPRIRTNSALAGSLAIFDNQGTFVAGLDLAELDRGVRAGTVTADPAGQYEVWIGWNGLSAKGAKAASGVYAVRLILRRDALPGSSLFGKDWLNKVYRIGWVVK